MSGSESGSEIGPGHRGARGGRGDLASRTLVLEAKRFYLDVKENNRGRYEGWLETPAGGNGERPCSLLNVRFRFIKIAEIGNDGRKNQIMMTLPTAAQFRAHLENFIAEYAELPQVDSSNLHQGELKSEVMFKEEKKYHIDLKVFIRDPALCSICRNIFKISGKCSWSLFESVGDFYTWIQPISNLHSGRRNGGVEPTSQRVD